MNFPTFQSLEVSLRHLFLSSMRSRVRMVGRGDARRLAVGRLLEAHELTGANPAGLHQL